MLSEEKWQAISRSIIETGFFDAKGRPETLQAIRRVMERMSPDELALLETKVSIIFAPAPGMEGQVFPLKESSKSVGAEEERRRVLVYLAAEIERLSQKRIESVMAHEFAHALLHAPGLLEGWFIEPEADQKVRSWGFRVAYPNSRTKGGG